MTYPQPIIQHPTTGSHWKLQVSNAAVLQVAGITDEPLTSPDRLQLVDPGGVAAYRLGLSTDTIPLPATYPIPTSFGKFQHLSIWSPNGREHIIGVNGAGTLNVLPLSSSWPMSPNAGAPTDTPKTGFQVPAPAIRDSAGVTWQMTADDNGIWTITQNFQPVLTLTTPYLWTQDDTMPFQVTVTANGILTVIDAPVTIPKLYEIVMASPGGTLWTLVGNVVNGDILLSITSTLQDAINSRDEWPLVISQHGNYLYISDDRFPPPIPAMPRRWGMRRRMPRRQA